MGRLNRDSPLPAAARPRVEDPLVQRAFDTLATPLIEVIKFLTPYRQQETWKPASFVTGWVDSSFGFRNTAYRKDPLGAVHLRGLPLRTSGASAIIMVLPIGYRPHKPVLCTTSSANLYSRVDISTLGEVSVVVGVPGTWVSLDGISFDTES